MIGVLGDTELKKVAVRYLEKATGQSLGDDAEAWRRWLEEENKKMAAAARPSPSAGPQKKPTTRKARPPAKPPR